MAPSRFSRVLESVALTGLAVLAIFLAATAAGWTIPGSRAGLAPSTASVWTRCVELSATPEIPAVRRFHHDVRQPRAPRLRSERPTSFATEHDFTAEAIALIIHDDVHRPIHADGTPVGPLAGHPLDPLRPPSVRA